MTEQNQKKSVGQVRDRDGMLGKQLSDGQDVGELSAQNRGKAATRSIEQARQREADRSKAAPAPAEEHEGEADACDASAELREIFAEEDRKSHAPAGKPKKAAAGEGNRAEAAEAEALNRETESYIDKPGDSPSAGQEDRI